jgi:hypothetical protein
MAGEPDAGPRVDGSTGDSTIAALCSLSTHVRFYYSCPVLATRWRRGPIVPSLTRNVQSRKSVVHPDRVPRQVRPGIVWHDP